MTNTDTTTNTDATLATNSNNQDTASTEQVIDSKIKTKKSKFNHKKTTKFLKVLLIILIILTVLICIPMQSTTYKTLRNGDWNNEVGTLRFNKMFKFSYFNAGSGSPVGDADLYPLYIYLGNNTFITLGTFPIKIGKIHDLNDKSLLITYDNQTLFFTNKNTTFDEDYIQYDDYSSCDECYIDSSAISSDSLYCKVLGTSDNSITISPYNSKDIKDIKSYEYTFKLAPNVNCSYSKQETELIDEYTIYKHHCKSKKLSKKDAFTMLNKATTDAVSYTAHIKFDSNSNVSELIIIDKKAIILELSTMQKAKLLKEIENNAN